MYKHTSRSATFIHFFATHICVELPH